MTDDLNARLDHMSDMLQRTADKLAKVQHDLLHLEAALAEKQARQSMTAAILAVCFSVAGLVYLAGRIKGVW